MSKDVKFNIKLSIDGKEHIVEATTDVKHFAQELGIAETRGKRLRDSLLKFNGLVTLFRSAAMEYKTASEGSFNIGRTHSFEYAILPHSGGDDLRTSAAAAEEWLFPPLLGRFPAPPCRLPGWEFPPGTILSTLKPADDGNGWFVRIVETAGAPAEFDLPLPPGTLCVAASALEEPQGDFAEMSSLHLSLRPFQLHSFLLSFREKRK